MSRETTSVRPDVDCNASVSDEGEAVATELPVTLRRGWLEPTAEEREVHNRTHMPYRAWCEFCIRGKADSAPPRRRKSLGDKLQENPVVSIDYMYMKASEAKTPAEKEKEESGNLRGRPILSTKDSATAWVSANVVPVKGDTPDGGTETQEEIDKLGHQRLVLKFDQEPAIKALIPREKHQDIS